MDTRTVLLWLGVVGVLGGFALVIAGGARVIGWLERLRAGRSLACSGCLTVVRGDDAFVLPTWSEDTKQFVTTFRCTRCFAKTVRLEKARLASFSEPTRAALVQFLEQHERVDLAERLREADLVHASKLARGLLSDIGQRHFCPMRSPRDAAVRA